MTDFYYARVSTDEQDMQMQINDALRNNVAKDNIICEQASGKTMDKRDLFLDLVYNTLQPGDTLLFWKIDRIGRSVKDLTNVLHDLNQRGVFYRCTTQAVIDSTRGDYMSTFMVQMLSAFAELERNLISERTKAGMAAAASRGVKLGRPKRLK